VRRILAQLAEVSPVLHPPTRASAPLVLAGNLIGWLVHRSHDAIHDIYSLLLSA
jgi:hypothetical protein